MSKSNLRVSAAKFGNFRLPSDADVDIEAPDDNMLLNALLERDTRIHFYWVGKYNIFTKRIFALKKREAYLRVWFKKGKRLKVKARMTYNFSYGQQYRHITLSFLFLGIPEIQVL